MKRQTCTDHCVKCDLHFHGLGAFDAHIVDGWHEDPATVVFFFGNREGEPRLQVWTMDGSCDKELGCWANGQRLHYVEGVTIWQLSQTAEQAERLASLNADSGSRGRNLTGLEAGVVG